jgi:hypothetical protein
MKTKHIVLVLAALLLGAGLCSGQMIQTNYNGTGIIYANTGRTEIGTAPPNVAITWPGLATFTGGITVTGTTTLATTTLTAPVIAGGLTASGSAANDFSASTGAFKTSTGANTFGGSTNTFTNGIATPSLTINSGIADHFIINSAEAGQTPAATTRTYITGSQIAIPATGLQVGTILHWQFDMTKTAAGTATSTIDIAFGTAGTTADTAQVSFTKPAGTAAADEGWVTVECNIKTINASTGVAIGEFTLIHNLSATGHAQIPCVVVNTTSGSFNTVSPTFAGLCITTGASDAITINQCSAWARGL